MNDERREENAALYVLNLLEGAELAAFESALARDAALRKLVDELRAATADIALLANPSAPSPALRDRVLASIASVSQRDAVVAPKAAAGEKIVWFPFPVWLGWAAAACFAITTAFFATHFISARSELALLRESEALARFDAQDTHQKLEAERIISQRRIADLQDASDIAQLKIAKLASLANNSPEALAVAVWNPQNQEGVLTVEKLPTLQSNQDYQLWVVDPKKPDPVSGGVFTVDAEGTARLVFHPEQPVSAATQFAVSRERKGGVPKAQGPIVLAGAL